MYKLINHVQDVIKRHSKSRSKNFSAPNIIPSLQSELGASLPLHVSLSRTLQIRTEDREDFLETLRSHLRRAAVPSFDSSFKSLKWVPNFERNRWFLVLDIAKPERDELNRLLNACNNATTSRGHSGLYVGGHGDGPMEDNCKDNERKRRKGQKYALEDTDRSNRFHISIAWNLEEPDPDIVSDIHGIDVRKFVQSPRDTFDVVKVRIGNVVHNIELKKTGKLKG